jgi:hypothetical protein
VTAPAAQVLGVLEEILDLLTDETSGCRLTKDVCRVVLAPGGEIAWDTCGESTCAGKDGQLWALPLSMTVTDEGPCERITFDAEIGIIRCAAPPGADGEPPSEEAVLADAELQAADADSIRYVIDCCEGRSERLRGIVLTSWRALGPTGGCVGGQWNVRGVLDTCC